MRLLCTLLVGMLVAFACDRVAAQYGQGGGGYGGGGGGYGGGGYSPPSPRVPTPSPYQQPGYRQPTNPYGSSPYRQPQTNHYRGQPNVPVQVPQSYEYYVTEEYLYCTNCNKKVSDSAKVGGRCPHCNIYWSHDDQGNTASGGGFSFGRIGGLIGAAVAIVIGLIVRALRG